MRLVPSECQDGLGAPNAVSLKAKTSGLGRGGILDDRALEDARSLAAVIGLLTPGEDVMDD
jgi:hypothetical protein